MFRFIFMVALTLAVGLATVASCARAQDQPQNAIEATTGFSLTPKGMEKQLEPRALDRTLYVWYRRTTKERWHGIGPYTLDEAYAVERDYIRKGYYTYIAGRNG